MSAASSKSMIIKPELNDTKFQFPISQLSASDLNPTKHDFAKLSGKQAANANRINKNDLLKVKRRNI